MKYAIIGGSFLISGTVIVTGVVTSHRGGLLFHRLGNLGWLLGIVFIIFSLLTPHNN